MISRIKNGLGQVDKPDTAAVQVHRNQLFRNKSQFGQEFDQHTPSIRCFIPSKPYRTLALERPFHLRHQVVPYEFHPSTTVIIITSSSSTHPPKIPRITPKPSVCVILGQRTQVLADSLTNNLMLDILDPRNSRELQPTERGDFFDLQSQQPTFSPRKANEKKPHAIPHKNQCESKSVKKARNDKKTHTLLHRLDIPKRHPDPPRPSQMPTPSPPADSASRSRRGRRSSVSTASRMLWSER
jgi:hypothetical protein